MRWPRSTKTAKLGTRADFEAAARKAARDPGLDPDASDLEGYLFPETYTLRRDTPATALIEQMTGLFQKTFTPEMRDAAKALGLSVREKRSRWRRWSKRKPQCPKNARSSRRCTSIASRIGMPMQADPTVIFALLRAGRYDGNLRRDDLQFDSPYNTYRYPGLPPGPIAAPGKASLEAAVAPAKVDYLYFVSKNDGSHVFARTLDGTQPQRAGVAGRVLSAEEKQRK